MRLRVEWTELHTHWEGDDYAGQHVEDAPPSILEGYVEGYLMKDGNWPCVIVSTETSLQMLNLDDLRIIGRED